MKRRGEITATTVLLAVVFCKLALGQAMPILMIDTENTWNTSRTFRMYRSMQRAPASCLR